MTEVERFKRRLVGIYGPSRWHPLARRSFIRAVLESGNEAETAESERRAFVEMRLMPWLELVERAVRKSLAEDRMDQ